jgi:hypothetical protein
MNKRASFAVAVLMFVLFAGTASAFCGANGNDDNQVIMRLTGTDNAHGALWGNAAYATKLCYDQFFTQAYGGNLPHECISSDRLLSLYFPANSHASFDDNMLSNKVCHKGLAECEIKENIGPNSCPAGKAAIVHLSGRTNAHLSALPNSDYPYVVCCKGTTGVVRPPSLVPKACKDYSDENYADYYGKEKCNSDSQWANVFVQGNEICPTGNNDCFCKWNYATSKCSVAYDDDVNSACTFTCLLDKTEGACNSDNEKEISFKASIINLNPAGCTPNAEDCKDSTSTISCVEKVPQTCEDYGDMSYGKYFGADKCNSDPQWADVFDDGNEICPTGNNDCFCKWDDAEGKCGVAYQDNSDPNCEFVCVFDRIEEVCENEVMSVLFDARAEDLNPAGCTPDMGECTDKSLDVFCERKNPSSCDDYSNATYGPFYGKEKCIEDPEGTAQNTCPPGEMCNCGWNEETEECRTIYNFTSPDPLCGEVVCTMEKDSEGECANGFRSIHMKGTADKPCGAGECAGADYLVPCGLGEIELPFFSVWHFAAALVMIICAYFAYNHFCKRRR